MLSVMEQLASQLTRLHELHLRGGLSDQEFEQAKSLLLQLQPQTPPKDLTVAPAKTSQPGPLVTEMSTFHHKHALWAFIATAVTILAFIIHCAGWRYSQGNGLISLALFFSVLSFFCLANTTWIIFAFRKNSDACSRNKSRTSYPNPLGRLSRNPKLNRC